MRLSDIMSAAGLTSWAEVALVIFLTVFVAITVYVLAVKKRARWERARFMPLDDETPQEPRGMDTEAGATGRRDEKQGGKGDE